MSGLPLRGPAVGRAVLDVGLPGFAIDDLDGPKRARVIVGRAGSVQLALRGGTADLAVTVAQALEIDRVAGAIDLVLGLAQVVLARQPLTDALELDDGL